ncbi:MAG: hypothetical protein JSV29_05740, partial [Candidatus Bathyarchaeota archaeon]
VMMFPAKLSAERAVRSVEKAVYAIKPLAGGRVSPKRAFTYVFNFQVEGCMIGVGSVPELKEDIKAAIEALRELTTNAWTRKKGGGLRETSQRNVGSSPRHHGSARD